MTEASAAPWRRDWFAGPLVFGRTMAIFAAAWWLIAAWTGNPLLLPSPTAVVVAVGEVAADGEVFLHAVLTVVRLLVSLAIAFAVAAPLGLAMGLSRRLEQYVDPVVELLRPISGIAWIPLGLFIFGVGHALPIFIMAYTATFPILLGVVSGVKQVDRRHIAAAQTMGLDQLSIVRRVVLPSTLPALLVSMRLGVASAWTAVIAAELVGAPNGLGYAISWYREMLMTPKMIAFIAMVGVSGYLCDLALRRLSVRLAPWAASVESRA